MKTANNLFIIILSSVVCLLPVILSIAVYNDLPPQVAIHWDIRGNADNYAPKALAAFGLPLFFMVINIIINIFFYRDVKRNNIPRALRTFVEWLIPATSLVIVPVMLLAAIGIKIPIPMIAFVFVGIIFVVFGYYMPKSVQNNYFGIKLPWTLSSADNWNKTHQMAGYLWVSGGITLIVMSFLSIDNTVWLTLSFTIIIILAVAPIIYSYLLYRRSGGE